MWGSESEEDSDEPYGFKRTATNPEVKKIAKYLTKYRDTEEARQVLARSREAVPKSVRVGTDPLTQQYVHACVCVLDEIAEPGWEKEYDVVMEHFTSRYSIAHLAFWKVIRYVTDEVALDVCMSLEATYPQLLREIKPPVSVQDFFPLVFKTRPLCLAWLLGKPRVKGKEALFGVPNAANGVPAALHPVGLPAKVFQNPNLWKAVSDQMYSTEKSWLWRELHMLPFLECPDICSSEFVYETALDNRIFSQVLRRRREEVAEAVHKQVNGRGYSMLMYLLAAGVHGVMKTARSVLAFYPNVNIDGGLASGHKKTHGSVTALWLACDISKWRREDTVELLRMVLRTQQYHIHHQNRGKYALHVLLRPKSGKATKPMMALVYTCAAMLLRHHPKWFHDHMVRQKNSWVCDGLPPNSWVYDGLSTKKAAAPPRRAGAVKRGARGRMNVWLRLYPRTGKVGRDQTRAAVGQKMLPRAGGDRRH